MPYAARATAVTNSYRSVSRMPNARRTKRTSRGAVAYFAGRAKLTTSPEYGDSYIFTADGTAQSINMIPAMLKVKPQGSEGELGYDLQVTSVPKSVVLNPPNTGSSTVDYEVKGIPAPKVSLGIKGISGTVPDSRWDSMTGADVITLNIDGTEGNSLTLGYSVSVKNEKTGDSYSKFIRNTGSYNYTVVFQEDADLDGLGNFAAEGKYTIEVIAAKKTDLEGMEDSVPATLEVVRYQPPTDVKFFAPAADGSILNLRFSGAQNLSYTAQILYRMSSSSNFGVTPIKKSATPSLGPVALDVRADIMDYVNENSPGQFAAKVYRDGKHTVDGSGKEKLELPVDPVQTDAADNLVQVRSAVGIDGISQEFDISDPDTLFGRWLDKGAADGYSYELHELAPVEENAAAPQWNKVEAEHSSGSIASPNDGSNYAAEFTENSQIELRHRTASSTSPAKYRFGVRSNASFAYAPNDPTPDVGNLYNYTYTAESALTLSDTVDAYKLPAPSNPGTGLTINNGEYSVMLNWAPAIEEYVITTQRVEKQGDTYVPVAGVDPIVKHVDAQQYKDVAQAGGNKFSYSLTDQLLEDGESGFYKVAIEAVPFNNVLNASSKSEYEPVEIKICLLYTSRCV